MIGAFALSRSRSRRTNNHNYYRRRHRAPQQLGAQAIFHNALRNAPTTRRGKICMKWDLQNRCFNTSDFIQNYLIVDVERNILDNVSFFKQKKNYFFVCWKFGN